MFELELLQGGDCQVNSIMRYQLVKQTLTEGRLNSIGLSIPCSHFFECTPLHPLISKTDHAMLCYPHTTANFPELECGSPTPSATDSAKARTPGPTTGLAEPGIRLEF